MTTTSTFPSRKEQQDLNARIDNCFRQIEEAKIYRNMRYAEVCHDEKTANSLRGQLKAMGMDAGMA